jgi:MFS family permease
MPNYRQLPYLLRAFRHRNYRLFFVGQTIALNGTWMTLAALGWLLFRLTGDPLKLGLMAFFMQAPTFFLTALGGVLVDHASRRKIILYSQMVNGLTVATLAYLTFSEQVVVWQVLSACALLGVVKAFELPARQALVADLVEKNEDLSNAIGLNASIFHGARMVGPMIAGGLIIPFFGEGMCFLVHAVAYIGAMRCFILIQPKAKTASASGKSFVGELVDGFRYTFGYAPVRALVLLVAAVAFSAMPYGTLLPVFAESVLGGNSSTYGQLLGAGGLGALVASIMLASRPSILGMGRVIGFSTLVWGLTLIMFAFSTTLWWSLLLLFVIGWSGINVMVGSNMIIQMLVEDHLRGRVMSLHGMVFMGALPLGSLCLGKAASLFGAPISIAAAAIGTILAGLVFLLRLPALKEIARPVYVERGILDSSTVQSG